MEAREQAARGNAALLEHMKSADDQWDDVERPFVYHISEAENVKEAAVEVTVVKGDMIPTANTKGGINLAEAAIDSHSQMIAEDSDPETNPNILLRVLRPDLIPNLRLMSEAERSRAALEACKLLDTPPSPSASGRVKCFWVFLPREVEEGVPRSEGRKGALCRSQQG